MNNLARALSDQGKYTEVEQMYGEVVEVRERALGKENPSTLASMNNLALVLLRLLPFAPFSSAQIPALPRTSLPRSTLTQLLIVPKNCEGDARRRHRSSRSRHYLVGHRVHGLDPMHYAQENSSAA
jgi:hypothetical protein